MLSHTKTKVNTRPAEPRVVTNVEAARQLGCHPRSIQRWRRKGLLTTVVVNGRARVLTESIRLLVERGIH